MVLEVAGWNMHRAETSPVPSLWDLSSQSGAHWRRERGEEGGRGIMVYMICVQCRELGQEDR